MRLSVNAKRPQKISAAAPLCWFAISASFFLKKIRKVATNKTKTCIQKRKLDKNKLLFKNKCPKVLKSRQILRLQQNSSCLDKMFSSISKNYDERCCSAFWHLAPWIGINSVFGIKDSLHCGLEHWIVYGEGGEPFFVEHFGLGTPPDKGKCSLNVTKRPLTDLWT